MQQNQIPYKFYFSHEGMHVYALLTPIDDYPLQNVDGHFDLSNFYNCVEDAIMAEIERLGADEQFYANNIAEALEFLEQALCGIAKVIYFDIENAKQIVL